MYAAQFLQTSKREAADAAVEIAVRDEVTTLVTGLNYFVDGDSADSAHGGEEGVEVAGGGLVEVERFSSGRGFLEFELVKKSCKGLFCLGRGDGGVVGGRSEMQ